MKVTILHIITSLDIGGAELMMQRLIQSKPELMSSTVVVSLTDRGKIASTLKEMGVTVISLNMRSAFSLLKIIFRLYKIIRSYRPSVIQTWMYHANLLGGIASRIANNKNIIWSIRRSKLDHLDSKVTFIVMKLCAILSSVVPHTIVCVADSAFQQHVKYGYNKNKMIVIPNGYDLSVLKFDKIDRNHIRNKLHIANDHIVVGIVGRFHNSKDYHNFVMSASMVIPYFENVRFMMIGRDLDDKNKTLKKWIDKTSHADRFLLLGEVNKIAPYMSAMDIFCLSSRTEGFPNVVAEAMCIGLPCVVTNVGDIKKVVGTAAIITEPCSNEALSDGLFKMLNYSNKHRKEIGVEARNRINTLFKINSVCDKYYQLYYSILNMHKKR